MMPNSTSVAYVLQIFPNKTETFVYREVLALRKAGINVITLANRKPNIQQLPDNMEELLESTIYIVPFNIFKLILANLWLVTTRLVCYLSAIRLLFEEPSSSPRIWLRNVMHFQGAVYLAYQIKNSHVNHLHAHFSNNATSLAMFVAVLLDIPFSMTVHNNIFVDRLLLPTKLHRAKFIVCISEYSRNVLHQHMSQPSQLSHKAHIVRCGIMPGDFEVMHDSTILHYPPTLISAAQLVERKGTRYLIEACAKLKSRDIVFRCMIAGDGEQRPKLESLVKQKNLEANVEFVGAYDQHQLVALLQSADVFVLPCIIASDGDRDGIPVVLMEAMAVGLPIVSTTVSGIPELVSSGHNGILVAEKDAHALADVIQQILDDADLRQSLGQSAQLTIHQQYNLGSTIHQLIALFEGRPHGGSETTEQR